jgi:hypothetical protein
MKCDITVGAQFHFQVISSYVNECALNAAITSPFMLVSSHM